MKTRIEFRILKLVTNLAAGDTTTVGLLHWDGHRLRHAFDSDRVPSNLYPSVNDARWVIERIEQDVSKASESPQGALDLQTIFPVREGLGGVLKWEPVQAGSTTKPEAHFAELCGALHLDHDEVERSRITERDVQRELRALGKRLSTEHPDRVEVDRPVERKHQYRSPLSWRNGRWHHTVPLSLRDADRSSMQKRIQALVGKMDFAMPTDDVPVVIVAMPDNGDDKGRAAQEMETLRESLQTSHKFAAQYYETTLHDGQLDLEALAADINRDVASTD